MGDRMKYTATTKKINQNGILTKKLKLANKEKNEDIGNFRNKQEN